MLKSLLPRRPSLLLSAVAAGLLTGCAPGTSVERLPFDVELRSVFVKQFAGRALDVGIKTITLSCDPLKHIQIEVGLQSLSSATPGNPDVTIVRNSETVCSEAGALVHVEGRSGEFEVRSKYAYDNALVIGQWQKAFEAAVGTLDYSEPLTARNKALYAEKLGSTGAFDVDFNCDQKSNLIHFRTFLRGDTREGPTTVACPADVETGHSVMRLLRTPDDYFARAEATPAKFPDYRIVATKAVTAEFAEKVVGDVVRLVGPREKF